MAELVVPDAGELVLIQRMLKVNQYTTAGLLMHLYTNDYTPNRESLLAAFTEVALGTYAAQALANADWQAPATVAGAARSIYGTGLVTFSVTSGTTPVYGYYVTDAAVTVAVWAQRFPSVLTLDAANPVELIPVMRLRSQSEPPP